MTFRLRPSSKKSTDTQTSLVQFPKPQTFLTNDTMTLKQLVNKIDMLESNVSILTEGIRRERDISSAGYIETQKRLDVLEYKSFANEKDIQQLSEINRTGLGQLPPLKKQNESALSKNELTILKQTLLQQRQSQKQHAKHMSQTLEQLSLKHLRLEQQLRELFNRTRTEHEDRLSHQTQQIQRVDQFKMRKMDNQYELMREQMQLMERKIVEELENKLRKEMLIKEYVQEQVGLVKQELMEEQRGMVGMEVKLTREMKQSLESLYAMIGQMKQTFGEELSETQELTSNNIKRLAMNLDVVDGKWAQRLKDLQQGLKDNEQQIVNFRQWVVGKIEENRQIVMGLQEEAIERMDNSKGESGEHNSSPQSSLILQQKLKHLQTHLQSWKSSIQQKNITIFKQISQTLKQIKLDYKKDNDQVSSELISLTQSLKQLKKSLPNEMKKISQTIVSIFNDEFDVLAEELDLMAEMIKVVKGQGQAFAKSQIKKHKEEFLEEIKSLIQTAKKQVTLSLQKSIIKSQQSSKTSLQKQSQFLQSLFNQRLQRLQSTTSELQTQSKKLNSTTSQQLQNFTLSMKQFNQNYKQYLQQQRKQDLKKRIELQESMRKNATNLMDIAYKKSQFLVEGMKKAIEMNEMKKDLETKQAIQGVKDQLHRASQQQKQDLFTQLKSLQQKLQTERKTSQQQLEDQLKDSINTLKKTLGIEIGNTKLQIDEKIAGLDKIFQEKLAKQRQVGRRTDQKLDLVKKDINDKLNQSELKIQQLQTNLNKSEQKIQQLQTNQQSTIKQLTQTLEKLKLSQQEQLNLKITSIQSKLTALQKTLTQQTQLQLTKLTEKHTQFQQKQTQSQQKQTQLSQKQTQFQKIFSALKQQLQTQKTYQKQTQKSTLNQLKTEIKSDIQKQFQQSAQKSEQTLKEYEETLNTLRETVWKLQAMNFSEQAKNKAIFDKINEDLNHLTVSVDGVAKEIKQEQKKKETATEVK